MKAYIKKQEGCQIGDEQKRFLRFEDFKKCPFCGRNLVDGYLSTFGTVYWDTRKHGSWGLVVNAPLKLVSGHNLIMKNIPARLCVACNFFIVSGPSQGVLKECSKCKREILFDAEKCKFCGARQPEK